MLRAREIEEFEFSKSKNGYDREEVDELLDRIVEDWNVFYLSIKCTCWNVRSYCYSENWWEYLQKARSLWDLANILYHDEHCYE